MIVGDGDWYSNLFTTNFKQLFCCPSVGVRSHVIVFIIFAVMSRLGCMSKFSEYSIFSA